MKSKENLDDISKYFGWFVNHVRIDNNNGSLDINKNAERFFIPILNPLFDAKFKRAEFFIVNYPAIDLISDDNKYVIQITSERNLRKIRKTISTFISKKLFKKFEELYILIIDEDYKPTTSSESLIDHINKEFSIIGVENIGFSFYKDTHIINISKLRSLIDKRCSFEEINLIAKHVKSEYESSNGSEIVFLDPSKLDINYPFPKNYIPRHLAKSTDESYWDEFFDKETLFRIVNEIRRDQKSVRIMLNASAGKGKSKEIDYLAAKLLSTDTGLIPLILKVKNYSGDLEDYIFSKYSFWNLIDKKNVLLLIDGLDEVNTQKQREFTSDFNHIVDKYKQLNIICSIRTNFDVSIYNDGLDKEKSFQNYYIKNLFQGDIKEYIEKQCDNPSELFVFTEKKWLKQLIKNPFYLVYLVELFNNNQSLPQSLKGFYEKIIQSKLIKDREKYWLQNSEEHFKFIKRLALLLTLTGQNSYPFSKLENKTDLNIADLKKNSLLNIYNDGVINYVSFEHNNFQEFLCAEAICDLEWQTIKILLFNIDPLFLKPRMLNTSNFIFSLLEANDPKYHKFKSLISKSSIDLFFSFEKDKIPFEERIAIFKAFIEDGKQKGIAYLAGDVQSDELIDFIDHSKIGLEYVIKEIKKEDAPSNHFHSLLFLIQDYTRIGISKTIKKELIDYLKQTLLTAGFKDDQYGLVIKILDTINKIDKSTLENFLKKCPLIKNRYVLTSVIEVIDKNNIPNQYEYVIDSANDLIKCGSRWSTAHEYSYSKYILDKLSEESASILLSKLNHKERHVISLLNARDRLSVNEDNDKRFINKIYIKLREIAILDKSSKIQYSFINFLLERRWDSYHQSIYGDPMLFFDGLDEDYLFKILVSKNKNGRLNYFIKNLLTKNRTEVLIKLHNSGKVSDDNILSIYNGTFAPASIYTKKLNDYLIRKFQSDRVIALKNLPDHDLIKKNQDERDITLLLSLEAFREEAVLILSIMEKEFNASNISSKIYHDLDYKEEHIIKEQIQSRIVFRFLSAYQISSVEHLNNTLEINKTWQTSIIKWILNWSYESSIPPILIQEIQNFAIFEIENGNFSYKDFTIKYDRNSIPDLILNLFVNEIINLPLDNAVKLLCMGRVGVYQNNQEGKRIYDVLIKKFGLNIIKPYIVKIIEDNEQHEFIVQHLINGCREYHISEIEATLLERLEETCNYKVICWDYLRSQQVKPTYLYPYLRSISEIEEYWQFEILKYYSKDTINSKYCLQFIENNVTHEPYSGIERSTLNNYQIVLGVKLGSLKCLEILFKYIESKDLYNLTFDFRSFEIIIANNPQYLLEKCLGVFEIYLPELKAHSFNNIPSLLDSLIMSLASQNVKDYRKVIKLYDQFLIKYKEDLSNISDLEWWKIRLIKNFEESSASYYTEKEAFDFIEGLEISL